MIFSWHTNVNGDFQQFTVSDAPIQVFSTDPINKYSHFREEDGKIYYITSSVELKSEEELINVVDNFLAKQNNAANMGENIRNNVQQEFKNMSENMKNILGKGFPFF